VRVIYIEGRQNGLTFIHSCYVVYGNLCMALLS